MSAKLIISIVQRDDADPLAAALRNGGFSSTVISTTGGFLRKGNATVLVGVAERQAPVVLDVIKRTCPRAQYSSPLPPSLVRNEMDMPSSIVALDPGLSGSVEVQTGGAVVFVLDIEQMLRF
jgi:uncharacterized protein YaaQ